MPLLSIVIPSLNVEEYIKQCVTSALEQSLKDTEILCIDAGSSDGTYEILCEMQKQDARIRVIASEKKSYGYQVNLGIQNARGIYIAVLESDDYVSADMYKDLVVIAEKHDLDVVKADYDFVSFDGDREQNRRGRLWGSKEYYGCVKNAADHPEMICYDTIVWCGIYRTDFLKKNNIWLDETAGAAFQDIGFGLQVQGKHPRTWYVDQSYYRYRYKREGASTWNPNVLRYVHQETDFILGKQDFFSREDLPYVWKRLADAFLIEYDKSLAMHKYRTEGGIVGREYLYFADFFGKLGLDTLEGIMPESQLEKLKHLLNDPADYAVKLKEEHEERKKERNRFVKAAGGRDFVIVGAGSRGRSLYYELLAHELPIRAVCDNSGELQGKEFVDHRICPVEDCVRKNADCCFAIANKLHAQELKRQLLQYHVPREQIWIYRTEADLARDRQYRSGALIHFEGRVPNLSIQAGTSYQTRAESTIDLTVKTLMEYLPLSGKYVNFDIYTGDKSDEAEAVRTGLGLEYLFAYSTKTDFPNVIAVPDFIYSSWKESGIPSWESVLSSCIRAGEKPYEDERLFWIGNVNTHPTRKNLIELSARYPELILAEGMEWLDDKKGGKLPATKFVPLYEQAKYKYLIDVQGNGYSGRLKILFFMGRPVFIAKRAHIDFFSYGLKDMENCVFVEEDMSDLPDKIRRLNEDSSLYEHIVREGRRFAESCLSKSAAIEFYGERILKYGCED